MAHRRGPKIVPVGRMERYCQRNDQAGHSKSPFIPHRAINDGTGRGEPRLQTSGSARRSQSSSFLGAEQSGGYCREEDSGIGRGVEKRLPRVKSRRRLFVVCETAADKSTSSFLFLSSPIIPQGETLRYKLPTPARQRSRRISDRGRAATRPFANRTALYPSLIAWWHPKNIQILFFPVFGLRE